MSDDSDFDDDVSESGQDWRRPRGIFVIAPIGGPAGERIAEMQRRYDPKLARLGRPHITIAGSSGTGPILPGTSDEQLRAALQPIASRTSPLTLQFGAPHRFMQTNIVSLPLDPHGPLRDLHDSIRASGLKFLAARFSFSPHATINYFPTIDRVRERELLSLRVSEPAIIDRLELSLTNDPQPPEILFGLELGTGFQVPD